MNIKEQRAIIDAASDGPWQRSRFVDAPRYRKVPEEKKQEWREHERHAIRGAGEVGTPGCNVVLWFGRAEEADMDFIAAAREEWPKALDSEDALGKALEDVMEFDGANPKPGKGRVNVGRAARTALAAWRSR